MNYLVYKHTSPSGKSYIGITNNLPKRNSRHRDPQSKCRAFAAAISKYGWDSFTHEVLMEGLTLDEANKMEAMLIVEHNTLSPDGYNLKAGGDVKLLSEDAIHTGGRHRPHTEASKKKMSESAKKRVARDGVPGNMISPEQQKRMAAARVGKPFTEERKRKLSEAAKRRVQKKREASIRENASLPTESTQLTREVPALMRVALHHPTDEPYANRLIL